MVSSTPSSSSPCVVKPVTLLPLMMDLEVEGSMIPGKIAPPWHLDSQHTVTWFGKCDVHGRDNVAFRVHLGSDGLKTLGIRVVDQGRMARGGEEEAVLPEERSTMGLFVPRHHRLFTSSGLISLGFSSLSSLLLNSLEWSSQTFLSSSGSQSCVKESQSG